MRVLALDLGERRIGVAASDPSGLVAQPLHVIARRSDRQAIETIAVLLSDLGVARIVVGLPRNMDGTLGPQAARAQRFAARLAAAVGVPVDLWDERLSTVEAERTLARADLSRRRRREMRDAVAASLVLDAYLRAHSIDPPGG